MRSFLNNIIQILFCKNIPDCEIISEVKFFKDHTPYFSVKMKGCNTPVDISAEEISEKFTEKFNQHDIKIATKVYMKYRSLLKLMSIQNKFAILYCQKNDNYQVIDLSGSHFLHTIDLNSLKSEDAFKLGAHFERMRLEKDRKLFNLTKASQNTIEFKLVKPHD